MANNLGNIFERMTRQQEARTWLNEEISRMPLPHKYFIEANIVTWNRDRTLEDVMGLTVDQVRELVNGLYDEENPSPDFSDDEYRLIHRLFQGYAQRYRRQMQGGFRKKRKSRKARKVRSRRTRRI